MKDILQAISVEMIAKAAYEFTEVQRQSQWLGSPAATPEAIQKTEERLQITLPEDYKEFLSISNGFYAVSSDVDPTFHAVEKIDYLRNIDQEYIDIWRETGNHDIAPLMEASILVAGFDEEQYFLLIPPTETTSHWQYWKFASWIPGEEPFDNLEHYFKEALEFLREDPIDLL
jgi:cell wall assembly regulator SMI1